MKRNRKMTEYEYGYEFAKWSVTEDHAETNEVDIEKQVHHSTEIPPEDYRTMVKAGIENPNSREYWRGYNAYMATRK
jgi:hypothetical protein